MPIENDIREMLDQYLADPADSDFQRGYLACLLEIYERPSGSYALQHFR